VLIHAAISHSYAVIITGKFQKRLSTYGTNKDVGILLTSDSMGSEGIQD